MTLLVELLPAIIFLGKFIGLPAIISILVYHFLNRKKIKAETAKTTAEAGALIVHASAELVESLKKQVELHSKKIVELELQVKRLKKQEKEHDIERAKLREKIAELLEENIKLKALHEKDSIEIQELRTKIKLLEEKLSNYVNNS